MLTILFSLKKTKFSQGIFSSFTSLKPNLNKCKISGIGALKVLTVAVCEIEIKYINLTKDCLETNRIYYSNNQILETEKKILRTKKI